ncbi:hypothetical protein FRB94_006250 [Tulasnella sp. JGI-2019a]|nr:hypothetical protein FRB94_006250 [Tulasnella sp. JGI-2019a]KAG9022150.1 hypothetical protein FRB95_000652 [Tulasnella sp. JGI-2019a]
MVKSIVAAALLLSIGVRAQVAEYGQCGGSGFTGTTTCVSPYVCTVLNTFYSQCLPGSTTSTTTKGTTSTTTTSTRSSTFTTVSKTTSTTTTSSAPASTTTGTTTTGQEIRADQDPVYHFYLQNSAGTAVLGPESGDGVFTINGTILDNTTGLYLNIGPTTGFSYRKLTFDKTASFSGWALEGDTIITATSSSYGRQLNFVVCETSASTIWTVYLQLGSDVPAGLTCTNYISLHLPCLC